MSKITRYIQFTCGRGPVEASRSCFLISNKFLREFNKKCKIEIVDIEEHKSVKDCYMSVMFSVNFDNDEENILEDIENNWKGTLCYKSTLNPYRPNHKRKNWFIGCNIINPIELPVISDNDIVFETMRSGGSGGQNTNKVETCVRAVYKHNGLSVKCSDERSQKQNKERARERLLLKLYEEQQNKELQFKNNNWLNHTNLERGNPVQTFSGNLKDILK